MQVSSLCLRICEWLTRPTLIEAKKTMARAIGIRYIYRLSVAPTREPEPKRKSCCGWALKWSASGWGAFQLDWIVFHFTFWVCEYSKWSRSKRIENLTWRHEGQPLDWIHNSRFVLLILHSLAAIENAPANDISLFRFDASTHAHAQRGAGTRSANVSSMLLFEAFACAAHLSRAVIYDDFVCFYSLNRLKWNSMNRFSVWPTPISIETVHAKYWAKVNWAIVWICHWKDVVQSR